MSTALVFALLCIVGRLAYTANDYLTGRLSRTLDPALVCVVRGLTLGVVMAPMLLWVPARAWAPLVGNLHLAGQAGFLGLVYSMAVNYAARVLPFGLRAALVAGLFVLGSAFFDWLLLGERLGPASLAWAVALAGSSVAMCLGTPPEEADQRVDLRKGVPLILAGTVAGCWSLAPYAQLVRLSDPILAAWAWELVCGLMALPLLLVWRPRGIRWKQVGRVALAVTPTAIGSGATATALTLGPMGVAYAFVGLQSIITALIGLRVHGERLGWWRWVLIALSAVAIAGMTLLEVK